MKRNLLAALLAACVISGASAETKVTVTPLGENPAPRSENPLKKASLESVLVNEDFSGFTDGTIDEPDYDNQLASLYENENIDPSLTHGDQWKGHKVYPAGGMLALRTFNPGDMAYIQTPLNDYSGSVTVSFRAKFLMVQWEEEGVKFNWPSSIVFLRLISESGRDFKVSERDPIAQINIYPTHGWCDVTVEFDNYSAYNDASILLSSSSGVIIDDVKVTSSADNFIASPIITGLSNVTETSFTVDFEPVRTAYNYYGFLFSLEGYNDEGEPIYQYTFPEATLKELEGMGMSVDDYVASMAGYENYLMVEMTDRQSEHSITFTDLNPEKEYYFAIASHYVKMFSDYRNDIRPLNVLPTPLVSEAKDIRSNAFTAQWNPLVKAENYKVTLYGVNKVMEDTENFSIFDEDFSNVSAFTTSTDMKNPDVVGIDNDITLDDLTSTPGWTSSEKEWSLVDGKLGISYTGAWVKTPSLFVDGDDEIRLSLRLEANSWAESFIIRFAGVRYDFQFDEGVFEDEIILPTNGMTSAPIQIACADDYTMFIDYLTIGQSLEEGDLTYLCIDLENVEAPATSFTFEDLDNTRFDYYGYSVQAFKGEGKSQIKSEESERMIVDLANGKSFLNADITMVPENVTEVARYTVDGQLIDAPCKGLNIVKYSDGSVRKVIVK